MANSSWNPADKTASVTLTGSNLIATGAAANQAVRTVDKQTAGKFYWEFALTTVGNTGYGAGCANASAVLSTFYNVPSNGVMVYATGDIYLNNVLTGPNIGSFVSGTAKLCMALDLTGNLCWARNGPAGNWNGSGTANPATGVGGMSVAAIVSTGLFAAAGFNGSQSVTANFGDSAFTGVAPAGFTAGFPGPGGAAGASQARVAILA